MRSKNNMSSMADLEAILIESDIPWFPEYLNDFRDSVQALAPTRSVYYAYKARIGIDPTTLPVWETFSVWLPAIGDTIGTAVKTVVDWGVVAYLAQKVGDEFVTWARKRLTKEGEQGEQKRPKYVLIYGPQDVPLRAILVKNEYDEPEDRSRLIGDDRQRHMMARHRPSGNEVRQ
jgi:hypothetical protein